MIFYLYTMSRKDKPVMKEKQVHVCLELGWEWGLTANRYEKLYWGEENVLKLDVVVVAQLNKLSKNP